jgi:large subunit ribosomal protein L29
MSKAKEVREMSDDQLAFSLREAQESLFNLKFQASTEKLDAPSNLKKTRREIARLHTILHERARARAASENAPVGNDAHRAGS